MPHAEADAKDEKGVDTHSRSQTEWFFSIKSHHQCTDSGSQDSSGKDRTGRHSLRLQGAKDTGVHSQNICHGEKGSDTCKNLCTQTMLRRVKPE